MCAFDSLDFFSSSLRFASVCFVCVCVCMSCDDIMCNHHHHLSLFRRTTEYVSSCLFPLSTKYTRQKPLQSALTAVVMKRLSRTIENEEEQKKNVSHSMRDREGKRKTRMMPIKSSDKR